MGVVSLFWLVCRGGGDFCDLDVIFYVCVVSYCSVMCLFGD